MFYFTKYANQKFDILNKHKVFFTRELIEDTINAPEKLKRKGKNYFAHKDGIGVVYEREGGEIKVITFYPVKL